VTDFSFVHAADIHLDSPLHGLSRYDGVPVDEVRGATRAAFDNLIGYAIKEEVDFVILAGDLFDGDWRDMGTGLYFARAMGRLAQANIRAFVLRGNHDAASVLTATLPWPDNVHVFSSRRPETVEIGELRVALHGRSFANAHVTDNLAAEYPEPVANAFNIGVLHTALAGHANHAPYAPCSVAQLQAKGYDYWALGHVHDFSLESEHPPIVFPGNLQGRNIRETGPKGAVIIEVHGGHLSAIRLVELDVLRWASVEVDCSEAADIDDVHQVTSSALSAAHSAASEGRPLIVRVKLTGQTTLAGFLRDRAGPLRDEVRSIAAAISPQLWLEKLMVSASAPPLTTLVEGAEDIASVLATASSDGELIERLDSEFAQFLTSTSPPEGVDEGTLTPFARKGDWRPIIEAAASALLARLQQAG
jgi:exonuclease SbcD